MVPPRARVTTLSSVARVTSSEPLAAIEVLESAGRLSLAATPAVSSAASALTFADAIVGGGYSSKLTVVNTGTELQRLTVSFASWQSSFELPGSSSHGVDLNSLAGAPVNIATGAVKVYGADSAAPEKVLLGVVDIENAVNQVSLGSRAVSTDWTFPHVAHGSGFFTGLSLVTGNVPANVRIETYTASGDFRVSGVVQLPANYHGVKMLSEWVPDFTIQLGGYIRIRSDQPILAWEVYGSDGAFASGPPL
jgi:hypothetical protein